MNKKFALLMVLVAALVMGTISSAAAAEIKANGAWQIEADFNVNNDFQKKGGVSEDKTFNIAQRVRQSFQFIANENLKGVLEVQLGTANWGTGALGIGAGRSASLTATGSASAGNGNFMLRKGYVDFKWPGTKVNFLVGFQSLSLPSAVGGGSPVLDDHFAAAAAVVPVTDGLSLVGGFGRLYDANSATSTTAGNLSGSHNNGDVAFLIANVDMFKGFSIKPWVAYASLGKDVAGAGTGATALAGFAGANSSANEGVRAYWGGAAFTMTAFDPFKVMADFNYGKATWNNQSSLNNAKGGRQGFLADIAVDYTGLSMMTPSVFFAYSSGESGNSTDGGKSDRMPVVGTPQNYALGSFWLQGGDSLNMSYNAPSTTMGYWALGLSLKDIKLIDKLSHTVHLIYFKGTNDPDFLKDTTAGNGVTYSNFLTNKDSLWEVDVNTKYQIYDELSLGLELGYINPSFDKDTWGAVNADYRNYGSTSAYKASLLVNYSF
ncbi:MAG: outer membrane homotrimeric porin [Humidesulfovibrio sp.]|uniref:outer membrane homotrimeric porin n=1 Tax=Humidesulfovibrio sp. TaxID=2910988 RepID=UPI0027EAC9CB|nr:outer membrane homotrimeric porin [Humidesulfovibrio sp.]MDQ7834205.1 outer membrane homotrimeric porin [Humidesulfovibrio sp.]